MSARILVVDDILPNVKLLEAKLMAEYYEVITAQSGAEALEKVASENPDIILLDVMMPEMDGFEVCKRIKDDVNTAHLPVVMVTALTDTEDKVRGLEAGADDFLSKPINDVALMARVRSLVRLKMATDEWRARENTANQLGVMEEASHAMAEPVENARVLLIENKDYEVDKFKQVLDVDKDIIIDVPNGMDAMKLIREGEQDFDVVVVSLNLEGEDGLRLSSHLKSNERMRNVPIVMVAEEGDMERIARGLEIGAHDYLLRPIDRNELLARVRTQVRRKRFQERLRSSYEISLSMALTDSLTGLYNRRYLDVHLAKMIETNVENQKKLCVLLADIDKFKSVNDTYGHNVGDEVLKVFAQRLKDNIRSFDLVARQGGEEFVAILPDVTDDIAYRVSERLRASIADEPIPCSVEGGALPITSSFGGVLIEGPVTVQEALERADQGLYAAKEGGRNQVVFEGVGKLDQDKYRTEASEEIE